MEQSKTTLLQQRYFSVVTIICLGLCISIFMFFYVRNSETTKIEASFKLAAWNRINSLERELENNMETLRSVRSLCESREYVTRNDFKVFCQSSLLRHHNIQALEWIPCVSNLQRENHEKKARAGGYPSYQITKRGTHGEMVEADESVEYYPAYYVEPQKGNEDAIGFDLSAEQEWLEALYCSRDTGKIVATSRVILVPEKDAHYGFLIFLPVYGKQVSLDNVEERRKNLTGFVLGVFRVGNLVETSLGFFEAGGIDLHLFDMSSPQDTQSLYFHPSRLESDISQPLSHQQEVEYEGSYVSHTLNIAGRKWSVLCKAIPEFAAQRRTWNSWGFMGVGLLITGLLVVYFNNIFERTVQLAKAKEKIQESEKKSLLLLNSTGEAIYGIDLDGNCTFCNPVCMHLLGYKHESQLLGQNMHDLIHHTRRDGTHYPVDECCIYQAFKDGRGAHVDDEVFWRVDGTSFDSDYRSFPIFRNVKAVGSVVSFVDITEHRRLENELKFLNTSLEQQVADRTADLTKSNYRLQKEVAERKHVEDEILRKSELIKLQQELTSTANDAKNVEDALVLCMTKMCSFMGWPVGHIYMPDSADKLIPTSIWYMSDHEKFEDFQKITAKTVFKFGEGMPGRIFSSGKPEWIPDLANGLPFLRAQQAADVGLKSAFAFPVLEREKVVAVLEFFSETVVEPDTLMLKNLSFLAIQLGRITERMKAEGELKALNESLEITVRERTLELLKSNEMLKLEIVERQLNEKERDTMKIKMLATSKLASLGEIVTGIAHEINQPLTYINSFIQRFKHNFENNTIDGDELKQELNVSFTQINRIVSTIDHLRIFGRSDTTPMQLVKIEKVLDNTLLLMREGLRLNNIELLQDIEPDLPELEGSSTGLEQVFINLFQNAMDAFPGEYKVAKVHISIHLTDDREQVIVKFSDNGIGIEKKVVGKIFEPFFTTKEVGKGTGLGLAIVYGIIKDHNGLIECKSTINKGTVFIITLPLNRNAEPQRFSQ